MPKYFTRDQAGMVLPQVTPMLREALRLKEQYAQADSVLRTAVHEITMRGGMAMNTGSLAEAQRRREAAESGIHAVIGAIQEHGCLVKDLDAGLLDFPTLYEGKEVYLCWRLGEPGIGYWHGVDEGFGGRKAIDDAFLAGHGGNPGD